MQLALKVIGSAMVVLSSGLLGYLYAIDCKKRPQELRALQGLLQMFETEITYASSTLVEAFEKISGNSRYSAAALFKSASEILKNDSSVGAREAWERAVKSNARQMGLDSEDENILFSFGKMLGSSDLEGQVKNIRLLINQLKIQEARAEEKRKQNERMYKTLGLLGGLAIVIVLL